MPGPWVKDGSTLDLKKGSYIEAHVRDDGGKRQGTVVLGVRLAGGKHGGMPSIVASYIGSSDPHYGWWMRDGDGKKYKLEGWYHLCGEKPGVCPAVRGKSGMIHLEKMRELSPADFTSKVLSYLTDKTIRQEFKDNMDEFNKWLSKKSAKKKDPADVAAVGEAAEWHADQETTEEDEEEPDEPKKEKDSPEQERLLVKLKGLRKELEAAEKEAADYQAKKKDRGRAKERKGNKEKKKKDDSPEKKTKKKEKKKRKRSRSKSAGSKGGKATGSKDDPGKDKKRRRTSSSDSTSSSKKAKPLFGGKEKEGKPRGKDQGDRGPFGQGPSVNFSEDSDGSDETVFRDAPSKSMKSSQLQLLNYSRTHPGRLASRMLLKMEEAVARGVEGAPTTKTPAVAMNHLLTVLQPSLQGKLGMRSLREMKTIAQALDYLATNQASRCADLLAQRLKAIERATHEQHWNTAQFLELLKPEHSSLLEKDEELYLAREFLLDQKARNYDQGRSKGKSWDQPKGRGKGKDDHKGDKGKGKDKGKKDQGKETWRPEERSYRTPWTPRSSGHRDCMIWWCRKTGDQVR